MYWFRGVGLDKGMGELLTSANVSRIRMWHWIFKIQVRAYPSAFLSGGILRLRVTLAFVLSRHVSPLRPPVPFAKQVSPLDL